MYNMCRYAISKKVFVNRVDGIVKNTHTCVFACVCIKKKDHLHHTLSRGMPNFPNNQLREKTENQCNGMENVPIIIYISFISMQMVIIFLHRLKFLLSLFIYYHHHLWENCLLVCTYKGSRVVVIRM